MKDRSDAYDDGCWVYAPFKKVVTCEYGDRKSDNVDRIWSATPMRVSGCRPCRRLAEVHKWHLTTYLASACTPSTTPVVWDTDADQAGCLRWAQQVQRADVGR